MSFRCLNALVHNFYFESDDARDKSDYAKLC